MREAFIANRGREIDTQGDSFFVAFHSAADAVAAAVDAERRLAGHAWPDAVAVRVRIGIHSGEAAAAGERYVGFSVHRAARIGAAAHGGQVLVSDSTRSLVEDDLPDGVALRDLGLVRLKDIERPERISQVVAEGLQADFPPLHGAEPVKPPAQPLLRRRALLAAMLAGVLAAAVAIPLFALGGGSGGSIAPSARADIGANSLGLFEQSKARLVGQAEVGSDPSSVAAGSGSVWVANVNDDSVSRIDPKTASSAQTIAVGSSPAGVTTGGGFVWVANSLAGTVTKIDPNYAASGGVVDTIPVGNGPTAIVFGAGRVWVANSTDRTVTEIDPVSDRALPPLPISGGATAVAFGFGLVWVAGGNSVTRIDPRSRTVLPQIPVGNGASALAVGADAVWVANGDDGTVSRIDPAATDQQPHVIPVGTDPIGVAAGDGAVWVISARAHALWRIDPSDEKVARTVSLTQPPAAVALSNSSLYLAVGASGVGHRGGTLTAFMTPGDFRSIDPGLAYTLETWAVMIITNDGLVTFKRVGGSDGATIVPDLATSVPLPTDGGRTYTFQLRRGIHYSTAALVQPADFRRAIQRSLLLKNGTGFYFKGLVGAAACGTTPKPCDLSRGVVSDPATNTVTFHLTAPDPDFLDKLATSSAYAVPAGTALKPRLPLPATGPYMIESYHARHSLVLVRNPHFHEWSAAAQPDGYPNRIVLRFRDSLATADRAVERGKADFAYAPNDDIRATAALRKAGFGSELHIHPTLNTEYFFLNTRVPPFSSLKARQAVSYALDRNQLIDLSGGADVARMTCQMLPPNLAGYRRYCPYTNAPNPYGAYTGSDLARARQLVAASGTTGQRVTVWSLKFWAPQAAYLVSVLRSVGYRARVATISDDGKYFAAVSDARRKIQAGTTGWNGDYPSSSDFFYPLITCRSLVLSEKHPDEYSNFSVYCNHKLDREVDQARALQISDPQSAAAAWAKVDHDFVDQAPWIPYANVQLAVLVSRRVGNYEYNPQWQVLLDQLWVR